MKIDKQELNKKKAELLSLVLEVEATTDNQKEKRKKLGLLGRQLAQKFADNIPEIVQFSDTPSEIDSSEVERLKALSSIANPKEFDKARSERSFLKKKFKNELNNLVKKGFLPNNWEKLSPEELKYEKKKLAAEKLKIGIDRENNEIKKYQKSEYPYETYRSNLLRYILAYLSSLGLGDNTEKNLPSGRRINHFLSKNSFINKIIDTSGQGLVKI